MPLPVPPLLPWQPHLEGVPALDVHAVSKPGGTQLPMAPAQQDRGSGSTRALSLQVQLEEAGLRPVQVVVEDELGRDGGRSGEAPGSQRPGREVLCPPPACLTEQLQGPEAWNSGL